MKNFSLPAALLIVLFSACNLNGDDDNDQSTCGLDQIWSRNLENADIVYEELDPFTGNRILIYENLQEPENICTDDLCSAIFEVDKDPSVTMPAGITFQGKAYWGQNEERYVDLTPDVSDELSGMNLEPTFSSQAGWIGLQIICEFPTQGSIAQDKMYVDSLVHLMAINFYYKDHL